MKEYGMKTLPSSYSAWMANREHGWAFTVNETIQVAGLRVYLPDAQTVTASLWVSNDNTALRQTQINSVGNTWSEGAFEKITLETGKTYIISCYTANCYYTSNARSATYDPRINYSTGRHGTTRGVRPDRTESNYTYPFIDIIIKGPSYKSNGSAIITETYTAGGNDAIYWTADVPIGTSLAVSASVNNGMFMPCTNGGLIPSMVQAGSTCNLRIKVDLATTNEDESPIVTQIRIVNNDDRKVIVLGLNIPNISPAVGSVKVHYDGQGALAGYGGPAEAFEGTFTPTGLTWKGHQNDTEHIEFEIDTNVVLTPIIYYSTKEDEHIELDSIIATIVLTDAHDL